MVKVWVNGEFLPLNEANVSVFSHSFGRGSAIFEVLDIVPTVKGPAFFGLGEHVDRFFNTANLVSMELPVTKEEIASALIETARVNTVAEGFSKFFAYYPVVEYGLVPKNFKVDIAVLCIDFTLLGRTQDDYSAPVSVGISNLRKLHPETNPIRAKIVGNYVNSYLAKLEVIKRGYEDVIMLDTASRVAEGGVSNIFFIKNEGVKTPPLENILSGITRKAVIEVIKDMGVGIEETHISLEDLAGFDEAFYTSSVGKVQPVKAIEGKFLGKSCPGLTTCRIMERMKAVYAGKIEKFEKWLTYVK